MTKSTTQNQEPPCRLFSITQYECTTLSDRFKCYPLERVFRQCGENNPAVEVTNRLLPPNSKRQPTQDGEGCPTVDPKFITNPPRGKNWSDLK